MTTSRGSRHFHRQPSPHLFVNRRPPQHHHTCESDSNLHTLQPPSQVIFSARKPWRQRRRSCTFISRSNHHLLPHESATEHAPDLLSSRTTINASQNQSAFALRQSIELNRQSPRHYHFYNFEHSAPIKTREPPLLCSTCNHVCNKQHLPLAQQAPSLPQARSAHTVHKLAPYSTIVFQPSSTATVAETATINTSRHNEPERKANQICDARLHQVWPPQFSLLLPASAAMAAPFHPSGRRITAVREPSTFTPEQPPWQPSLHFSTAKGGRNPNSGERNHFATCQLLIAQSNWSTGQLVNTGQLVKANSQL